MDTEKKSAIKADIDAIEGYDSAEEHRKWFWSRWAYDEFLDYYQNRGEDEDEESEGSEPAADDPPVFDDADAQVEGKYRFTRSSGCRSWKSHLRVERKDGDHWVPAFILQRNYHGFWHLLVEDHPANGHDYLLYGQDYQGHDILDLTTGENKHHIPLMAAEGCGWCIGSVEFHRPTCALVFDGCYWACPYHYVVSDFSNPDSITERDGIPVIVGEQDSFLDASGTVTFEEDGSILWSEDHVALKNPLPLEELNERQKKHFYMMKEDMEAATEYFQKHVSPYLLGYDTPAEQTIRTLDHTIRIPFDAVNGYGELEEWKSERLLAEEAAYEKRNAEGKEQRRQACEASEFWGIANRVIPTIFPEAYIYLTLPSQADRWEGMTQTSGNADFKSPSGKRASVSFGLESGSVEFSYNGASETLPRTEEALIVALKRVAADE